MNVVDALTASYEMKLGAEEGKTGRSVMSHPHVRHASSLLKIFHKLLSTLNLDEMLGYIAKSTAELLDIPYVALWVRENDFLEIQGEFSGGIASQSVVRKLRLGEGIAGRVTVTRKIIYIENVQCDPRWVNSGWARRCGLKSCLSIPLVGKNEVVGALTCLCLNSRRFASEDMFLAAAYAQSAAFAIENSRVHTKLEASHAELQRRHEMLMRAEKLATLGTMASGLAHEILNPANVIGLYAQRLEAGGVDTAGVVTSAEVIRRNVQRISEICEHFRRFSRSEAAETRPLDPHLLINETIPLVRHECRMRNVEIDLKLTPGEFRVLGEQSPLQQVFVNLLSNAKDAMSSGGKLCISTQRVSDEDGEWWEARVRDSGPGIPPEIMKRIFDPFFTTKPKDKGTGLGLFVSYGIIQNHHGRLWAESAPGEGSTFIVRLPLPGEEIQ